MKKKYEKPGMRAIEINAEQTVLTGSYGAQFYNDEPADGYNSYWD